MSSFEIRTWYSEHAPDDFQEFVLGTRFWQPKSNGFHVDSAAKIQEKLADMHLNPIRAGLVQQAADWRWSTVRWYWE